MIYNNKIVIINKKVTITFTKGLYFLDTYRKVKKLLLDNDVYYLVDSKAVANKVHTSKNGKLTQKFNYMKLIS